MASVSVWPQRTAVAFWLLVALVAARSSPFLMRTTESKLSHNVSTQQKADKGIPLSAFCVERRLGAREKNAFSFAFQPFYLPLHKYRAGRATPYIMKKTATDVD